MSRSAVWTSFEISLNDVDFSFEAAQATGYLNVFTPFAELYHFESISRGLDDQEKKQNGITKSPNASATNGKLSWKPEILISTRIFR